jgi:hypothetical protein
MEVSVQLSDLEVLRAALNSAHAQNMVLDLAEQYRKLSTRPQPSAMTKSLERAIDQVDLYIAEALSEQEESTDGA